MATKSSKDYLFVAVQFALFAAYFIDISTEKLFLPAWARYLGLLMVVTGVVFGSLALIQLRTSFSPFPTPVKHGELVRSGTFALARHPIYTGILLAAFGYTFYSGTGDKLSISLALLVLFYFKSRYEERLLSARYPEYRAYQNEVGRFLRWL
jgi:protein-S-isoprenylcysteine O-methyltransferase Ste14